MDTKKCGALFFLLLITTCITHAASSKPQQTKPVTANAYFLDTVLWPYSATTKTYNIPVCWEKFSQSTVAERANVATVIANTWQKFSLARFTGWGQCPLSPLIFNGIRITVDISTAHGQPWAFKEVVKLA